MNEQTMLDLRNRFLRYVQVDTQSEEASPTAPSTAIQLDLQHVLQQELAEMGAQEILLTDYGCLFATIPSTVEQDVPTVALLAHVDTTAAFSGFGVKPLLHEKYDGAPIVLPDDP
ncbi:MAG: peptidase T, partial [Caldilineaceae bacterium]|nr:peptidase T [Caldilineaceae bacterium]